MQVPPKAGRTPSVIATPPTAGEAIYQIFSKRLFSAVVLQIASSLHSSQRLCLLGLETAWLIASSSSRKRREVSSQTMFIRIWRRSGGSLRSYKDVFFNSKGESKNSVQRERRADSGE